MSPTSNVANYRCSNLMRNIVGKIKLGGYGESPLIPAYVFSGIGNLAFEQLSTLRHRGAFSTVSLTFARCCQLTQHQIPNFGSHQDLLEQWYQVCWLQAPMLQSNTDALQGTLQCISEQASTTRRSAGIPALITGILSSNAHKPAFGNVLDELKVLARRPAKLSEVDETNLPQVHAMNSLKEIFRSSVLGKRSEGHVPECLQIAANSLNSEM